MSDGLMFPHAVRVLRERAGMSQAAFAARLGHGQVWCSRIEAGEREPTLQDLEYLSFHYGLTIEEGQWRLPVTGGSHA